MSSFWLFAIVAILAAVGFFVGISRAISSAGGDKRKLHSLPSYYGSNIAIFTIVPSAILLVLWMVLQPIIVSSTVASQIPETAVPEGSTIGLVMSDVQRLADGLDTAVSKGYMTQDYATSVRTEFTDIRARLGQAGVALGSNVRPEILKSAQKYRAMTATGNMLRMIFVIGVAVAGFLYAFIKTSADFRARNTVEKTVYTLLLSAASIAILTTVGIVLSLIFTTGDFFSIQACLSELEHYEQTHLAALRAADMNPQNCPLQNDPLLQQMAAATGQEFHVSVGAYFTAFSDFFFGLTWSPSFGGGSQLGILPLLWGTFYISLIALLVAVPIGLFAAIYLSEYAPPSVRSFAKPMLEILAGIPTIVYGLFALLTVGPLLVSVFGNEGGLGWMQGGTAVMTAGLVMGIMLIPFVSSLSDDIINAVPQAMRDGSFGLGATQSETIRQVVLPAALPGIVGAVLLAASRAIGETMIVVLGAGAAARLSMNPFDAMTTVTAKIVSQLTGDADFASPEALVAFALGMTLFVITLGLNVFALYIVRKYREQYE